MSSERSSVCKIWFLKCKRRKAFRENREAQRSPGFLSPGSFSLLEGQRKVIDPSAFQGVFCTIISLPASREDNHEKISFNNVEKGTTDRKGRYHISSKLQTFDIPHSILTIVL